MRLVPRAVLVALAATACGKGGSPVLDAADDLIVTDTTPAPPDKPRSLSVDFAVEGCPAFNPDPVTPSCTGKVPLALRFVPLATTTVLLYQWNFGDASPFNMTTAPSHVFTTPGVYTVNLIATSVAGEMVTRSHTGFIVAKTNTTGEPCDANAQCATGLFCLCPPSETCSVGLARGVCTADCLTTRCGNDEVCANLLTIKESPTPAEPWQTALCLPKCTSDAECRDDMRCRTLPPGQSGAGLVHGCFAEIPRDVGEPCQDASSRRRDDFCASGLCVDLGIQGMCSMKCDINACPTGSDCVLFGDGRRLCLRRCTSDSECLTDPLLTCMAATDGDLGYQLVDPDATNDGSNHCAPKACTEDAPCAPAGFCDNTMGAGHCIRR
jgi:hypothetical protein